MESVIKLSYPNVIFTKLIHSTFEKDAKENNSQDMTAGETQLTSKPMECDVDMRSQEDSENDSLQGPENSYFFK